ncbi:MAG: formylglycine-generating enzyme family protein, partial [Bacteroidetes bacterium]|nr:formylglycine-generating enzyme family protein [Bacteroidota bacterium]
QIFIGKINSTIPGLGLQLPTEAQWEYACRAGTTTPFHFGDNITTDQVNFNGNYPYNKGEKGEYRKQTVPVKSFACNDWGLYEMHGNIWEWCADWYGEYPKTTVVNPLGPEKGGGRVVRGGSWNGIGRIVRSANRIWNGPADRDHSIGFRVARGQTSSM